MSYTDRFVTADNIFLHLGSVVSTITDASILASYAGFLSVSAITVYELAIKDIFNEFATKKHIVFGSFVEKHFNRINGRIRIPDLRDHINQFGDKYLTRFNKILAEKERSYMTTSRNSISAIYNNLIQCRHDFVHRGSPTLTMGEVINNYRDGKEIINCLNDAMKR